MKDIFKIRCHRLIVRLLRQANPFLHLMCNRKIQLSYEDKAVSIGIRVLLLVKRQVTVYIQSVTGGTDQTLGGCSLC